MAFLNLSNTPPKSILNQLDAMLAETQTLAPLVSSIDISKPVRHVAVVNPSCYVMAGLVQSIRKTGIKVSEITVPTYVTSEVQADLKTQLSHRSPDMVIFRNRIGLDSSSSPKENLDYWLAARHIPYRSWWLDEPTIQAHLWLKWVRPHPGYTRFFHASTLARRYPASHHLLPAASPVITESSQKTEFDPAEIVFVGQSRCTNIRQYLKDIDQIGRELGQLNLLAPLKNTPLKFPNFFKVYPDIQAQIQALIPRLAPHHRYYVELTNRLLKTATNRLVTIHTLASRFKLAVFGDPDWVNMGLIPDDYYKGPINFADLKSLYQTSAIHLHINFSQVNSSICPKILDCWHSGGFILTQPTPDLLNLHPQTHHLCYGSLSDLDQKIRYFLNHPQDRVALTATFQELAQKSHHLDHRISTLVSQKIHA